MPISRKCGTFRVRGVEYIVLTAPEPLEGGADGHIDHDERVIWLSPNVTNPRQRERVIITGVAKAFAERAEVSQ